MTKPKWTDRRDELAKEYGLKVAKHSWERGPVRNIDGTYREFSNRPDIFTESAFRFGYDAARADMQAEIAPLVEALEFYASSKSYIPEHHALSGTNGESDIEFDNGRKASEALANYKKQMEGK